MHTEKIPQSQLKLTEKTMFWTSQQTGLEYVLSLDPDRLLAPCYTALGKKTKAKNYGGWESQQIQGHSLGHYLSALAGFSYSTGNTEAKQKLDYTVNCIKEIQRKDGYFGGIPSTCFEKTFNSHGQFEVNRFSLASWWVPWYSVHKIYAGLIDAYIYGGNETALKIVRKMADWAIEGSKNMNEEEFQKMLTCEHGGMCKVYADLYEITKDKKYLSMAERFIHKEIIEPLIQKQDKLQGYHANTQIPKIIGLAKLYEITKKEEYRTAVEFFFNTVVNFRSYVIGGNSRGEHFGPELSEPLERDTCETCNTYNMLELAEHVFSWNKTSDIADFYEKALYNHILASQDPESGAKTYFVAMLPGFFKIYCSKENAFWCCTGTGLENPERYNRFVVEEYDNCIYINLFIPSIYTTNDGWEIQIDTKFPFEQKAEIKILKAGKNQKSLKVRQANWLTAPKEKDGYKIIKNNISEGESYSIALPMEIQTRQTKDKTGNFSILYGPIVLAADLGNSDMPKDIVDNQLIYMNIPNKKLATIKANPLTAKEWVKQEKPEELIFSIPKEATDNGQSYILKPFFNIHHTRYSVYFNSKTESENIRNKKYESITIDMIENGKQQSEIEHKYKSFDTTMGYIPEIDTNYRELTTKNSFVSYTLKTKRGIQNKLVITSYGESSGNIKVIVDGKEVRLIKLYSDKGKTFVDNEIVIPESEQDEIEIKIISNDNSPVKLLELRTIK